MTAARLCGIEADRHTRSQTRSAKRQSDCGMICGMKPVPSKNAYDSKHYGPSGGEGGIRTHGTVPYNGFPDRTESSQALMDHCLKELP